MYMPVLYASSNNCMIQATKHSFNKYRHLLRFKKNEFILELGSGDGRTTVECLLPNLPRDVKEFVITDKSKIMLDEARKKNSLSRMKILELDIESKGVPKDFHKRFDHIFSLWCFHYVTNINQAVQNVDSMLKSGGETFITFLAEIPTNESWYKLSNHPRWKKYDSNAWFAPYYQNPKISEAYQKYFTDCGFKNSLVFQDLYVYDFPSEQEFKGMVTAINKSLNKIPKEELNDYLQDYFELTKKSKGWTIQRLDNGEELPSVEMKLVTLYGQKI